MLDEKALRRADFSPGYAVELGDSQLWTLPAVKVRIFPDEQPDGSVKMNIRPWYADQMEPELDILFGMGSSDYVDIWQARMTIASRLLKSNYDLPAGSLGTLLAYVPGDPKSEERWDKIRSAILGRDPAPADDDEESDDPKAPTPSGSDTA